MNRFNWRAILSVIAIIIAVLTIVYTQQVANKIAIQEKQNVANWVEAQKAMLDTGKYVNYNLATKIIAENFNIPIIETNEKDSITGNFVNLDTTALQQNKNYLQQQLNSFKQYADPIIIVLNTQPYTANKYYYGPSKLLQQVQYYPYIQLVIICLFVAFVIMALQANYKNTQNQVWAGLAKETAHQLGTPVTSLQGWVEVMKDIPAANNITAEIEKDVQRLLLITDRFGKIGSIPKLEEHNLLLQITQMVDYIKKRAGAKVQFKIQHNSDGEILALISAPLFDWVIENILKNALDAMDGIGTIQLDITDMADQIQITIADTGKGIAKKHLQKVFQPGFTTKKRGWGLGLTLTKRIVEEYHKGSIGIIKSEEGKGTTFKIVLKK
jgi:signal transduction histidine kinase